MKVPRRDKCYWAGQRAALLQDRQAVKAWRELARSLEALGDSDVPKFGDLLSAIRFATFAGKRKADRAPANVQPPVL